MKALPTLSAILTGILGSINLVHATEAAVELASIKPHPSIEHTHACVVVKNNDAATEDCNEPKCAAGGPALDAALGAKGLKRICRSIEAKVNRGYDVTYKIYGEKYVAWTDRDPEEELSRIGLTVHEEYTPTNPACPQHAFQEANDPDASECAPTDTNENSSAPVETVPELPAKKLKRRIF